MLFRSDVLPLAVFITNTIPKEILQGHTPFFLLMGREPEENSNVPFEDLINLSTSKGKIQKNRAFAHLLREILIASRLKNNKMVNRKYRNFPEGTLVYEKDFSVVTHKKIKQKYKPAPLKVIKQ